MRILTLLLLTACTPLAGDWEGDFDCEDDEDADVDNLRREFKLTLEPDGSNEFEAEWELNTMYTVYEDGDEYDVRLAYAGDGKVETDDTFGEQDLDHELNLTSCKAYVDGDEEDDGDCDEDDYLEDYDAEWDGANTIKIDSKDIECEGELERE